MEPNIQYVYFHNNTFEARERNTNKTKLKINTLKDKNLQKILHKTFQDTYSEHLISHLIIFYFYVQVATLHGTTHAIV